MTYRIDNIPNRGRPPTVLRRRLDMRLENVVHLHLRVRKQPVRRLALRLAREHLRQRPSGLLLPRPRPSWQCGPGSGRRDARCGRNPAPPSPPEAATPRGPKPARPDSAHGRPEGSGDGRSPRSARCSPPAPLRPHPKKADCAPPRKARGHPLPIPQKTFSLGGHFCMPIGGHYWMLIDIGRDLQPDLPEILERRLDPGIRNRSRRTRIRPGGSAGCRSEPASWKTPASRSSGAGSSGRGAVGRKRTPTPCSPPNAASKTIAEPTSSIGRPIASQPIEQR